MKYVILVGDGMADHPLAELNGKTPLMAADKPGMDYIAAHGVNGMCATVPDGMVPESDTANLAIMGYDPKLYSKGRSPLEAMSIGIDLKPNQTAVRANIVTLSDNGEAYDDKTMMFTMMRLISGILPVRTISSAKGSEISFRSERAKFTVT